MMCWLLEIIAVEAITEILVDSEFFQPWRAWLAGLAYPVPTQEPPKPQLSLWQHSLIKFHKLATCGYCMSVWVAAAIAFGSPCLSGWGGWLLQTMVLHRLSNWLHVVYEIVRKGRVRSLELSTAGEINVRGFGASAGTRSEQIFDAPSRANQGE